MRGPAACAAPPWAGPPARVHGDLHSANIIVRDGAVRGVIDFGLLGMGDPAVDLMVAWTLPTGPHRATVRAAGGVDEDTWARGRGWAIFQGAVVIPYYRNTNPALMGIARHTLGGVLADLEASG